MAFGEKHNLVNGLYIVIFEYFMLTIYDYNSMEFGPHGW